MEEITFGFDSPLAAINFADWCDANEYDNDDGMLRVTVECPDDDREDIINAAVRFGGHIHDD